jgi:hypothetical protein
MPTAALLETIDVEAVCSKLTNRLFTSFRHPDHALPGFVSPIEKPPPIVPEAAFLFLSAAREIEREFSNHNFESTGRTS